MTYALHLLNDKTKTAYPLAMLGTLLALSIVPCLLIAYFFPHHSLPTTARTNTSLEIPVAVATTAAPTEKAKNTSQAHPPSSQPKTLEVVARPGDTLGKIFKRLGLSAKNLQQVIQNRPQSRLLRHLKPGQTLTFTIQSQQVQKLIFPYALKDYLEITLHNKRYEGTVHEKSTESRHQYISTALTGSLDNTAKHAHIPLSLVRQMAQIFHREIDFKKDVHTGDRFSILYQAHYIQHKLVGIGKILAVTYINRGKAHQAVQYTNQHGTTDYYTPTGYNLQKSYDRYPLRFSHITSPFSTSRYHPLLHYRRPHYGIDLAAPMGTPIHAIGDGRIAIVGRQSGYGNMIKINHNDMYSTIYGHLLRFQKGIYRGMYVKRGQIIGYVGRSGLASGPHCHFEFRIHHQPKNPSTIPLPHADPIAKKELPHFKQQTHPLLAELQAHSHA